MQLMEAFHYYHMPESQSAARIGQFLERVLRSAWYGCGMCILAPAVEWVRWAASLIAMLRCYA